MTGRLADGFILQLADPFLTEWMIKAVRKAAVDAGRDPSDVTICVAAPAYVGDDLAHAREQCRWFGGMVGNHVADLVSRYGEHSGMVPDELTDYIKARAGYDYSHHGRAGNPDTAFVPDAIVDRFCLLGPPEAHIDKLRALKALGVDQFAVYAMHDAKEATLDAYGERIIPALPTERALDRGELRTCVAVAGGGPAPRGGPPRPAPAARVRTKGLRMTATSPSVPPDVPEPSTHDAPRTAAWSRARRDRAARPVRQRRPAPGAPGRTPLDHLQLRRPLDRHGPQHPVLDARLRPGRARYGLEAGGPHHRPGQCRRPRADAAHRPRRAEVRHTVPRSGPCLVRTARRQPPGTDPGGGRLLLVRHPDLDRRSGHLLPAGQDNWRELGRRGGHRWLPVDAVALLPRLLGPRTRHHPPGDGDPPALRELGGPLRPRRRRGAADLDRPARPAASARSSTSPAPSAGAATSGRSSSRP